MREQLPRQQRAIDKDWIRNAIRRNLAELPEEQTEYNHHKERLDDGPRRAERRLLVTHLDVAPGQKVEQLAILPKLAEADRHPTFRRTDKERRQFGLKRLR